ncbi:hypothetical protein TI39_contig191g00004 [Zymoseptoria brevis]|uniref:Uncharacterized protein n=1 Tax=Zymoseptoria brevis TaxID=1047168 RepID=A0A0F4H0W7_9PEZI|nr:hypothetical protein TI39_contig191g00004 [Zymoseptoria brevis]
MLRAAQEIYRKMTSPDGDAYLPAAMIPIYDRISQFKANGIDPVTKEEYLQFSPHEGWPARRKATFRTEVTKPGGVWAAVYNGIERDLQKLLRDAKATLKRDIVIVFQDFRVGFSEIYKAKDSFAEEVNLKEVLRKNLQEARELMDGTMRCAFVALWRDFH